MNVFRSLQLAASAPVARERLQILLSHERDARGKPDLLAIVHEEILRDHRRTSRWNATTCRCESMGHDRLDPGNRRRNSELRRNAAGCQVLNPEVERYPTSRGVALTSGRDRAARPRSSVVPR